MGIEKNSWGPLIVHFAFERLDEHNRALFEEKFNEDEVNEETKEVPNLNIFLKFLEVRFKI